MAVNFLLFHPTPRAADEFQYMVIIVPANNSFYALEGVVKRQPSHGQTNQANTAAERLAQLKDQLEGTFPEPGPSGG